MLQNSDIVAAKLQEEISQGRVAGPFDDPPFSPHFHISPLANIPKKTPGEYRLVLNLSYPRHGDSINSGIDRAHCRVTYEDFDHCLYLIHLVGTGCYAAKSDLKHAFRILPVNPDDYKHLGFMFNGKYYYDKCLVMGASTSCADFEKLSTALQFILTHHFGVGTMSHILDDFIFFAKSQEVCASYQDKFEYLCRDLNLPIKHAKTVRPCQLLELHGLLTDTLNRTVALPQDKCANAITLLEGLLDRNSVRLRDLQSVVGTLNFCCRALEMGRPFLRRLIDLTMKVSKPHHHIRLNKEACKDIEAWLLFLHHFNGTLIMRQPMWTESPDIRLYSDSSDLGFGVIFGSKWAYGRWPRIWLKYHIAVREMYPITLALHLWGHYMKDHRIMFFCDNQAVAACIAKQTSKDPLIMRLIRQLVVAALTHNIVFSASWIPGASNVVADLLSRLRISQAQETAPWLQPQPTDISPCHLPWARE